MTTDDDTRAAIRAGLAALGVHRMLIEMTPERDTMRSLRVWVRTGNGTAFAAVRNFTQDRAGAVAGILAKIRRQLEHGTQEPIDTAECGEG